MARKLTLIEPRTAAGVRKAIRKESAKADLDASQFGVGRPIEFDTASGLSRCRECGERIPAGDRCVAFPLDLYGKRFEGRWGHAVRAYIHYPACPNGGRDD